MMKYRANHWYGGALTETSRWELQISHGYPKVGWMQLNGALKQTQTYSGNTQTVNG